MRNSDATTAIILVGAALGLLAIFNLSRSIGANFQVTLGAVVWSGAVLAILGVLCWTPFKPSLSIFASLAVTLIWPGWWKVIDSIAHGGSDPDTLAFRFPQELWWNTTAFKYGIEIGLVALLAYVLLKQYRDPYSY